MRCHQKKVAGAKSLPKGAGGDREEVRPQWQADGRYSKFATAEKHWEGKGGGGKNKQR